MAIQTSGISLSGVDNVIAAFDEYKSDIESFLAQIADTQEYTKAYKGLEQAVQSFVEETCNTVKIGVVNRINHTTDALKRAKEEYTAEQEEVISDIKSKSSKFIFDVK